MNGTEYREWLKRGFHITNAMLLAEIAKGRKKVYMAEEKVRTAFVEGLLLAKPEAANRVSEEKPASWRGNVCWNNPAHGSEGKGSPLRHDVWIDGDGDPGAVCELKWLKAKKGKEVAQDIWKLALSRGTTLELSSLRCFMLVGGTRSAFTGTLDALRVDGADFRWSKRGGKKGRTLPDPRNIDLEAFQGTPIGGSAFAGLLGWGKSPRHTRTPPPCRKDMRIACRASWELSVGGRRWRLALWELDARGHNTTIAWPAIQASYAFGC